METVFGLMVGVIVGWAFIWVLRQGYRPACPKCRGKVPVGATRCLHCHENFAQPAVSPFDSQRFSVWRVALLLALLILPSWFLIGLLTSLF